MAKMGTGLRGCNPVMKSRAPHFHTVIPAKAGTQGFQSLALDPRFRGDDEFINDAVLSKRPPSP